MACDGNPCSDSKICALSERASLGYQCVDKELEMVMVLAGSQQGSMFDLEKQIENIIKSAPNNANVVRSNDHFSQLRSFLLNGTSFLIL